MNYLKLAFLIRSFPIFIFSVLIYTISFGQRNPTYIDSFPQPIVFYGYDLTHLKLVDTTRTAPELTGFVSMISNHMQKITLQAEAGKFIEKGIIKKNFQYTSEINNSIVDSTILTSIIPKSNKDLLQQFISSYQLPDSTGTGMVVIYNYFDRKSKTVSSHTILFDIKSRKILKEVEMKLSDKGFYIKLEKWRGAAALSYIASIEKLNFRISPFSPKVTGKFFIGPTIGTGSNTISGSSGVLVRAHIQIGITSEYRFNDKIQIQSYLLASTKGMGSSTINPDNKVTLRYIDFIANLKYTFSPYFYTGIGGQAGYLASSHYRYLAYGTDYYDNFNIDEYTNDFDFGLNFCFGFRFANGFNLELSWLRGLRQIFNEKSNEPFDYINAPDQPLPNQIKGYNSVVSVSCSYLIGLKKKEKQ